MSSSSTPKAIPTSIIQVLFCCTRASVVHFALYARMSAVLPTIGTGMSAKNAEIYLLPINEDDKKIIVLNMKLYHYAVSICQYLHPVTSVLHSIINFVFMNNE